MLFQNNWNNFLFTGLGTGWAQYQFFGTGGYSEVFCVSRFDLIFVPF